MSNYRRMSCSDRNVSPEFAKPSPFLGVPLLGVFVYSAGLLVWIWNQKCVFDFTLIKKLHHLEWKRWAWTVFNTNINPYVKIIIKVMFLFCDCIEVIFYFSSLYKNDCAVGWNIIIDNKLFIILLQNHVRDYNFIH